MKNFKKSSLALFLVLSVIITMFSGIVSVSAEQGTPATEVYIGGVKLDATNKYVLEPATDNRDPQLIAGTESTATIGDVLYTALAEFDAENGKLTFKKGYQMSGPASFSENDEAEAAVEPELLYNCNIVMNTIGDDTTTKYGIKADGDLTIDLGEYHNSLFIGWNADIKDVNIRGIDVNGDLTITGTKGSLKITGSAPFDSTPEDEDAPYTNYGINATGDVNLLGGTVYIYDRPWNEVTEGETSTFINAGGDINVNGAKVKFRARKGSAYCTHTNKDMIIAEDYITTYDENIELSHNKFSGSGFTVDRGADYGNDMNLTLTPQKEAAPSATEVYFAGLKLDATNKYLLAGAWKSADPTPIVSDKDSATINEQPYVPLAEFDAETGTLTFKMGYNLTTADGATEPELLWNSSVHMQPIGDDTTTKYGIKANGSLTIDLGEYHNSLFIAWNNDLKNVNVRGIDVNGDLTIKGTTGSLRITGSAPHDETPNDGDAPLMNYGINATGNVNLLGGTVFIYDMPYNTVQSGDGSVFINAEGNIILDGAKVKFRARKAYSYCKHTNKNMIISNGYIKSEDANLELDHGNKSYGFTVDKGEEYGNKNNLTLTPSAGYKISIGKDDVQLGGLNKYLYATEGTKDTFTVGSAADGAIAEYNSATETLKFLGNATLEYWLLNGHPIAWIIKSNDALTIDLNGKNVTLNSAPSFGEGGTINTAGDLTIKGGGTLNAHMRCVYIGTSGGSVIKSGGKVKIEDATVNAYTSADRAHEETPRMSYVIDATDVEFTADANVRLATGATDAADNVAGRVFKGEPTITVSGVSDAVVGNLNAVQFGAIPEEDATVTNYTSDRLATSTYFGVSAKDKTVSIDALTVAEDSVTISLSGTCESVYVLAASYDENGTLVDAGTYSGESNVVDYVLDVTKADSLKVYVWDTSNNGMKPLKRVRVY